MKALRTATVLTVSDGAYRGSREDESGAAVARRLAAAGFEVAGRAVVPDERGEIERTLQGLAEVSDLVVTTGGTGFAARDVTPEATRAVIDREAPGLAESMRAAGTAHTPLAALSRGVAGILGRSLVLNLPGSPTGALESLDAVLSVLPHALDLLAGETAHEDDISDSYVSSDDLTAELSRRAAAREEVVLATAVRVHGSPPCRPGQKLIVGRNGPLAGTLGCAEFDSAALADAPDVLAGWQPVVRTYEHELGSVDVYLEPHRRRPRLVVLGATPVARWLLRWGRDLGYETVLVEPRPERITPEHRKGADRVIDSPDVASLDEETDVIHTDHEAPLVAEHLAALVRGGIRFAGLMGSARHAGPHLDALRALGLTEEEIGRVQTPVGLDVGARTPQEIALSILAGLVAARSGRDPGWLDPRRR